MYFDFLQEQKRIIQFYYPMEAKQRLYIQEYKDLIKLAKQNQNNQLLLEARQMLATTQYFYHSFQKDRLEIQDQIKCLIS